MRILIFEATGGRSESMSIYKKCTRLVSQSIYEYEKTKSPNGIYDKAKIKMKKAGYKGQNAAVIYMLLKFVFVPMVFLAGAAINYPSIVSSLTTAILIFSIIEIIIAGERRKISFKFQKYVYKIYKYLHNQISSGVKVTDAVKTACEVIDDKAIKEILIRLSARYELTMDIDSALEEFISNFDIQEAETLYVALKQGIITGDNQQLLERQEDIMFKKYFNYIQAETDSCKTRGVIAAAMFVGVAVIMVVVPLLNDISEAAGKIFIS